MIDIFYTGAGNVKREQQDPVLSLGSFISESFVPNSFPGSLFSDINENTINETIVLAFLNTDELAKNSVLFTVLDLFKTGVSFKAGAVEMVLDTCGFYKTQKVPNKYSIPRGIELTGITSYNAHLIVDVIQGDIPQGTQVQILDGVDSVVDFNLISDPIEEVISAVENNPNYYATKKFNYENNRYEVFIFRKNLINFATVTSTLGLTIIEKSAETSQLNLGDLEPEVPVALFLQRIVKINSKSKLEQNCERLFTNFKEGIETGQQFEFTFRIDYPDPV